MMNERWREHLFLIAHGTDKDVVEVVNQYCVAEEQNRLDDFLRQHKKIQMHLTDILQSEAGLADTMNSAPANNKYDRQIEDYLNSSGIKKSGAGEYTAEVVEVDKLVALQKLLNIEYCNELIRIWGNNLVFDDLVEICLSPTCNKDPVQYLANGVDNHVFSSQNRDFRYLGSHFKMVNPTNDIPLSGGVPVAAITCFVGYGVQSMLAVRAGSRYILKNGFHRAYALKSLGITHIPVFVEKIPDVRLNFPMNFMGFPRSYVLENARPPLMKDYFEKDFCVCLKWKRKSKVVQLRINGEMIEVPL